MRIFIPTIMASILFAASPFAYAQTVIYQDDFEGAVAGWSDNSTDYDNDTTTFLGRYGQAQQTTSRTFTVPAGSTELDIEFDLYRFDSWDGDAGDSFTLVIDGTQILSLPFPTNGTAAASGTTGNVDWAHSPIRGPEHFAFANYTTDPWWRDQIHNFKLTVNNPGATVAISLNAILDQNDGDESAGYDNFLVTVPEVLPAVIDAVDDDFTSAPIPPGVGGLTASIFDNDTLDNAVIDPTDVTLTVLDDGRVYGVTVNSDGTIDVPTGTVPGIYRVEYQICDVNDVANCDTAIATIAVQTTTPDVLENPADCGGWTTKGWLTFGPPINDVDVVFNSGNYADDPYLYEPLERDAQGRILSYMGTADEDASGALPARAGSSLIGTPRLDPAHMSEYHRFAHKLLGVPSSSETITYDTVNAADFTAYWIEDTAGNVLQSADFIYTRTFGGIGVGESFPITIDYPASGEVILHSAIFDPTAGYGRPILPDYVCPAPSLSIAKTANDRTDRKIGEIITYTYTAENTGNVAVNTVSISDQHTSAAGTSSLPVSGETGDAGNSVDSTDAATDGSWDALAPGDSISFTSTYVVTEADIIAGGDITNTATITGTPAAGTFPPGPISAQESVSLIKSSADLSISKTNTAGLNGEVDQASDTLTSGDTTTYTLVATNNGPDDVTGAIISDVVGGGLTCAAGNAVTISGDGVPTGSFTVGDLTGAGITLGSLADGEAAILTYSCVVN